jgi:hypothetical protein
LLRTRDRVGVAGLRHRFSLLSGIALDVGDTTQPKADAPGLRAAAVHYEGAVSQAGLRQPTGRLRNELAALRKALDGRCRAHHAFVPERMLARSRERQPAVAATHARVETDPASSS